MKNTSLLTQNVLKLFAIAVLVFNVAQHSWASNLTMSKPMLYNNGGKAHAVFNIKWEHAWNNSKNHDAVWVFFKSKSPEHGYEHINVAQEGHEVVSVFSPGLNLNISVPEDGVGFYVYPSSNYRGNVEATLHVTFVRNSFRDVDPRGWDFSVYGIEMVHIPQGGFTVGAPDTTALPYGAFYHPNAKGEYDGTIKLKKETQSLEVGENADLYYRVSAHNYEGDQKGVIPANYPKGVNAFYIMKYEPSEGEYIAFLNSLDSAQLQGRIIMDEPYYYEQGGSIKMVEGKFRTEFPNKPCLFLSWNDGMAFADWAGLRPMTEFEFTKAARGPVEPTVGAFPWGSDDKSKIQRLPNSSRSLVQLNEWDESQMSEENKAYFGASYYWVFDLAGSLWERVITVGHPTGRAFEGIHGDGVLSETGMATVGNWPKGGDAAGGIGFRGGGFYGYDREYHEYNPYSPIAYRRYGGWHGPMRNNAYGVRFVRSDGN